MLLDVHGEEISPQLLEFRARRLPPLLDDGSISQALGISSKIIFSIIKNKSKYYRLHPISKKDGRSRIISAPRTYLKVIQWWILDNILRNVENPDFVTGFVKGRGPVHNARLHLGAKHILNVDFKDFFPSIKTGAVQYVFETLGYDSQIAEQLAELCTLDGSLPQGAPTSPSLANLRCASLDLKLSQLAQDNNLKYSRYCDDLTFSSSRKIRKELVEHIKDIVRPYGLTLNDKKTRVIGPGSQNEITGFVISDAARLPAKWRNRQRALAHQAKLYPQKYVEKLDHLRGIYGAVRCFDTMGDSALAKSLRAAIEAVRNAGGLSHGSKSA